MPKIPMNIINDSTPDFQPEFITHHSVTALFGISRSFAYDLAKRGLIKSVSIRQRGALKGKRLFVADSIRTYLLNNVESPSETKASV